MCECVQCAQCAQCAACPASCSSCACGGNNNDNKIWLGLQVADSSRRRIVKTPSDASGMRKWISRGRLKGSTPPQADVTIVKSTTHLELKADEPANRASWTSEAVVTEEEKV